MTKQREAPALPGQIRIALYHPLHGSRGRTMASNEPTGDKRRIGAVRKRTRVLGYIAQARSKTTVSRSDMNIDPSTPNRLGKRKNTTHALGTVARDALS